MRGSLTMIRVLALIALVVSGSTAAQDSRDGSAEVLLSSSDTGEQPRPDFSEAGRRQSRDVMVREQIADRGVRDEAVLDAMRRVPRHEFVPESLQNRAYNDNPLPIGHGQTISQPYIVGYMTEVLDLDAGDRVLEVGAGSGYQASILAEIVREVTTIEIVRPLAESAAERLRSLGYSNITVLHGDGYYGRSEAAPFDAIIVTAAASHVPPPLTRQLRPGGRMVIPVGRAGWVQNLLFVEKNESDEITTRNLMAVQFVPLTGGH